MLHTVEQTIESLKSESLPDWNVDPLGAYRVLQLEREHHVELARMRRHRGVRVPAASDVRPGAGVGEDPSGGDAEFCGVREAELLDAREAAALELVSDRSDHQEVTGPGERNAAAVGSAAAVGGRAEQGRLIVRNPAPWQRTIHGHETMLREEVFEQLLAVNGEKSAFRYAACGLGDSVVEGPDGPVVSPMGCGHRLCPRCGRARGRGMIARIFGWLSAVDHQDVLTMCLTQRVIRGETLVACRARMRRKEHEYLQVLKERGLIAGASCAHIVWSVAGGGWHYHVHLLLEVPRGEWTPLDLRELYVSVAAPEEVQAGEDSSRLVCGAGGPDRGLVDGGPDPDFWSESSSHLARAVQYPVRDICQGISAVRCGGERERVRECAAVLLKHARGWKLRRTVGQWRKPAPPLPPGDEAAEAAASEKAAVVKEVAVIRLGTVHRLSRLAVGGVREFQDVFRALEGTLRNNTEFGKRFVAFCRSASSRGVT